MKLSHLYLILITFCLSSCRNSSAEKNELTTEQEPEVTMFYFIRHAEKDRSNPENKDPELTSDGQLRAEYWSEVLKEIPLDAVYSTDYKRTQQTAAPVAKSRQLEILSYDPGKSDLTDWAQQYKGGHILVVGHSNTTPALVNSLLGEQRYGDIDDSNNGSLFIVYYKPGEVSSIRLQEEPIHKGNTETP